MIGHRRATIALALLGLVVAIGCAAGIVANALDAREGLLVGTLGACLFGGAFTALLLECRS